MLTEFGKAIRKIRLDKGEILKDMAKRLGISSAFLSAVENGRKNVPEKWIDQIIEFYQLDEEGQKKLKQAYFETKDSAAIFGLENMAKSVSYTHLSFRQNWTGKRQEQVRRI